MLPLSLLVGDWLLSRQSKLLAATYLPIRPDGTPNTPWPEMTAPTAVLVMGDGGARRSIKGPGYLDDRAQPFDEAVVDALAKAAPEQLATLDLALAAELLVAGAPAWVAAAKHVGREWDGDWHGVVLYADAPYGVMYAVATWLRA
jgi:aromatic ring-opening dioxygenase LigB subunit